MERAEQPREIPETHVEGRTSRPSAERLAEAARELPPLFEVKDTASRTPGFAVRADAENGLVVLVDGRESPPESAEHVANGIFTARQDLPVGLMEEPVTMLDEDTRSRSRRHHAEAVVGSQVEHTLAEGDLFREHAHLLATGDRETPLELPASVTVTVVPEHVTAEEIVGRDRDLAEMLAKRTSVNADDVEWKRNLKNFQGTERQQRRYYETSKKKIAPLLTRAGRYLRGGEAAKLLEGDDELLTALKRGAADFLARFEREPVPDAVGEMRRQRRRDLRAKRGGGQVYERIARLPIFSQNERDEFYLHRGAQHDWGNARAVLEGLEQERTETATVRKLLFEIKKHPADAEARVERLLQTGDPPLAVDERMLLAEVLAKDNLVRDPRLLTRLREPDLSSEERAAVAVLEDLVRQRETPVADILGTDAFRGLSSAGRFALAERLEGVVPPRDIGPLLQTRAVSISGRMGNDLLVYRLREGALEPLHERIGRRGQETLKLRGLDRPVRANMTARESFGAEADDEFILMPAQDAGLRADATLAAAKDVPDALDGLALHGYPMVRIRLRTKQTEPAQRLDTGTQTG